MRVKDEKQIAQRRKLIMDTARDIMEQEGVEALSIRKISTMIEMTPGIIYHYFDNKDALMLAVVQEGYQNIIRILMESKRTNDAPSQQLRCTLRAYIEGMLKDALLYQVIMQSRIAQVQEATCILQEGLCEHRRSIAMLCECLEKGIACKEFACEHVELRAQSIWCCVYGVIERIIMEQPSVSFQNKIIEETLDMIMESLRRRK